MNPKCSNKFNSFYIIISLGIVVIFTSCHTLRPDKDIIADQEELNLRLLPSSRFEYSYYKLSGIHFENSKKIFCKGKYTQSSINNYDLLPDIFNNNSVNIIIDTIKSNSSQNGIHLILSTNIYPDKSNFYKIIMHSDALNLEFKGLKIDTIIKAQALTNVKFEIILPDFYLNGNPKALYKSITTQNIKSVNTGNLNIKIPITLDYFYYEDIGELKIKDNGSYYILDNEKK